MFQLVQLTSSPSSSSLLRKLITCSAALLLAPSFLRGQICDSNCPTNYSVGSKYAFQERITLDPSDTIIGNSNPALAQWTQIQGPCDKNGEVNSSTDFNVVLHAYYYIHSVTAPVGSHFETQLSLYDANGNSVGGDTYTRILRVNASDANPQSEWFNTMVPNVPAGNYRYTLRVRLLANGAMTTKIRYITAQGSPIIYGGGKALNPDVQTIGGSFSLIASATIVNTSGVPSDLQLQGYLAINSGATGDQIMLGFGIDGGSSNGHNSIVYVPDSANLPQGVNAVDHIPNEGVGMTLPADGQPHTITLYAKNLQANSTTIQFAEISAVGFPTDNGLHVFASKDSTPVDVSYTATFPQPETCVFLDRPDTPLGSLNVCDATGNTLPVFGPWTRVTAPVTIAPSNIAYQVTGDGYIELLGQDNPQDVGWTYSTWAQIGIEAVTGDGKGVDWGFVTVYIPPAATHIYFYSDAFRWGNGNGNTVTLWIRKVRTTPAGQPDGNPSFAIGRAYLGLRFVQADDYTCINVPPPSPIPAPGNVAASFDGTGVALSWSPVSAATRYDIYRFSQVGSYPATAYTSVSAPTTTFYDTAVMSGPATPNTSATTYLYAIKSVGNAGASTFSGIVYAPTFLLTDPVVSRGVTPIRGTHVSELRMVVDSIRNSGGLLPFWADYSPQTGLIYASHWQDLRNQLDAARLSFGMGPWPYTYPATQGSVVFLEHLTDLRAATQ